MFWPEICSVFLLCCSLLVTGVQIESEREKKLIKSCNIYKTAWCLEQWRWKINDEITVCSSSASCSFSGHQRTTRTTWQPHFWTKTEITSCITCAEFTRGLKLLRISHRHCFMKFTKFLWTQQPTKIQDLLKESGADLLLIDLISSG